jgi:hypothetical protein
MKKKLLAASVAAAFSVMAAPASAAWKVNPDGIGHINIIPYYSVQNGNDTHVSITNTDPENGKVVKVRFRGAEWSDDAFDFTIFLSPGDVWTGVFTQTTDQEGNPVGGLTTGDNSCTLPLVEPGELYAFPVVRLDPSKKNGTLEGYVEIITEGEIPKEVLRPRTDGVVGYILGANPLYDAIKHTAANNYVPPCRLSGDKNKQKLLDDLVSDGPWVWTASTAGADRAKLSTDAKGYAPEVPSTTGRFVSQDTTKYPQFGVHPNATTDDWIINPTGSLTSYVTIINVQKSKAVTIPSTAILNVESGKAARTVKRFFQQYDTPVKSTEVLPHGGFSLGDLTADRIFADESGLGTGLALYEYDLPDLTTPYKVEDTLDKFWDASNTGNGYRHSSIVDGHAAFVARDELAAELAARDVITEYVTDDSILAQTDVVITQPLRRFFYQYHNLGKQVTGYPFHRTYAWTGVETGVYVFGDLHTPYAPLRGAENAIAVGETSDWGREEEVYTSGRKPVFSPGVQGSSGNAGLQGEVSVLAINTPAAAAGTEALGALLTVYSVSFNKADGWARISTTTPLSYTAFGGIESGWGFSSVHYDAVSQKAEGNGGPLPVLGFTAVNIQNTAVGAAGTNYGQFIPLKVER